MPQKYPMGGIASTLASKGRFGDSELLHVAPEEIEFLEGIAGGALPRNPDTGQKEAFFFLAALPALAAAAGGIGAGALGASTLAAAGIGAALGAGTSALSQKIGTGSIDPLQVVTGGLTGALGGAAAPAMLGGQAAGGAANVAGGIAGKAGAEAAKTGVSAALPALTSAGQTAGGTAASTLGSTAAKTAVGVSPQLGAAPASSGGIGSFLADPKNMGLVKTGIQGIGALADKAFPGKQADTFDEAEYARGKKDVRSALEKGRSSQRKDAPGVLRGRTRYNQGGTVGMPDAAAADEADVILMAKAAIAGQLEPREAQRALIEFMELFGEQALQNLAASMQGEGNLVEGPGGGQDDLIPARTESDELLLSDGEYVVPADVVAHIGDGSSQAGAEKLNMMSEEVRMAKTGQPEQPPRL